MKDAADQFGSALETGMKAGDTKGAKEKLENFKKVVSSIKTDRATWKVPNSESAKNFHAGYEKLLKTQEDNGVAFGKVIEVFEDNSLSLDLKKDKIQSITQTAVVQETAALNELKALQKTFADEHRLKLK